MIDNLKRNRAILALYGKKSFGLIAKELGISRNTVAGVVFRYNYPPRHRVCSKNSGGSPNMVGNGRRPDGRYAAKTLPNCPPAGTRA